MKVVHNSKVNTDDIIAGTETAADIKDNKEETKEFLKKFEEYKKARAVPAQPERIR